MTKEDYRRQIADWGSPHDTSLVNKIQADEALTKEEKDVLIQEVITKRTYLLMQ